MQYRKRLVEKMRFFGLPAKMAILVLYVPLAARESSGCVEFEGTQVWQSVRELLFLLSYAVPINRFVEKQRCWKRINGRLQTVWGHAKVPFFARLD